MKKLLILALLFASSTAYARNCIHNGQSYPPGTVLGPLVCSEDGTWKQRR